jgi:hypothetical protein
MKSWYSTTKQKTSHGLIAMLIDVLSKQYLLNASINIEANTWEVLLSIKTNTWDRH